ncbi:MAG: PAS domain-containing sensor histidine kinase, partial [Planctomycetes bacterium]|nr:PAS domain-containing sensor histidine kinase [Planctomycetota bacterium]
IGFENKHNEAIFTAFHRLHRKNDYPGSGVGLAICRKIVRLHGGGISAEGRPGEGAIFRVVLPLRQGQEPQDTAG